MKEFLISVMIVIGFFAPFVAISYAIAKFMVKKQCGFYKRYLIGKDSQDTIDRLKKTVLDAISVQKDDGVKLSVKADSKYTIVTNNDDGSLNVEEKGFSGKRLVKNITMDVFSHIFFALILLLLIAALITLYNLSKTA